MIKAALNRLGSNDQRGGIAILTALGFLLFSVPLITSSLDLAQATAIDARFKAQIAQQHYCGLAVGEYFDYLVTDTFRWDDWLAANTDGGDPAVFTETRDTCGEDITIQVSQEPVLSPIYVNDSLDDTIIIPNIGAYTKRDFQVAYTVSDSNPTGGTSVVYTISVKNRTETDKALEEIKASVPSGFAPDCDASANQLTLPGSSAQDLDPEQIDHGHYCNTGEHNLSWVIPDGTPDIKPGEEVTITFTLVTSSTNGTYCSQAKAKPDENENKTGLTAVVQIGAISGVCPDIAMDVTKTWTLATLTSTDTSTTPYTYSFTVEFEILMDNIGDESIKIEEFNDMLPLGFNYSSMNLAGDVTQTPFSTNINGSTDREEVIWHFDPDVEVTSGNSKTLKFTATAAIMRGNYYSDLITNFDDDIEEFEKDKYTWPTALLAVRDVFLNTATTSSGDVVAIMRLNIADEGGLVNNWDLP